MSYSIREMGLGDILDQSIKLIRNHFKTLFLICCCLYLPTLFLQELIGMQQPDSLQTAIESDSNAAMASVGLNLLLVFFLFLFAMPLTNAAVTYAVAEEYLGRPSNVKRSLGKAFKVIIPMIWTWILAYIAIVFGLLLLIIPGVLFIFGFLLVTQVVIIENRSGFDALKRSWKLMSGNLGTAFVLNLVLGMIGMAISFAAAFSGTISPIVGAALSALAQVVALMLGAAAFVVLYFSARCKHEQFDMMLLAQALGQQAPDPSESGYVSPR